MKDSAWPSTPQWLRVALERLGQKPEAGTIEALSKASLFAPRTTEQPAAKAALMRMIAELKKSKPNYDLMSKELAGATRQRLPKIQRDLAELGDFKSATFRGVEQSMDAYDVAFANGALHWRLLVGKDGKVLASQFSSLPKFW